MLNSKELYGKISEWREDKGWTENKLCDIAGVSHSMFHSWISRGTMPKLDTLESLCYALDKPLAALLFDVDENKLRRLQGIRHGKGNGRGIERAAQLFYQCLV